MATHILVPQFFMTVTQARVTSTAGAFWSFTWTSQLLDRCKIVYFPLRKAAAGWILTGWCYSEGVRKTLVIRRCCECYNQTYDNAYLYTSLQRGEMLCCLRLWPDRDNEEEKPDRFFWLLNVVCIYFRKTVLVFEIVECCFSWLS